MSLQTANLYHEDFNKHFNKSWSIKDPVVKNVVTYSVTLLIILAMVTWLVATFTPHPVNAAARYAFTFFCMAAGVLHVIISPYWLPLLKDIDKFIYTILLSAAISLVAGIILLLEKTGGGLLPLAAASAFILPAAINLCWEYYSAYTSTACQAWYMPADMVPDKSMSILLNGLYFSIKIKVRENNTEANVFFMSIKPQLTLGEVFCRFLYDQQRIEVAGCDNVNYGWLFYAEGRLISRPLDPQKSLAQNGIKKDEVILIKRVSAQHPHIN